MIEQITHHHAVLPDFLLEMSRQMHQQDNRCTRDPIWVVCHDDFITCAEDRGDHFELINRSDHDLDNPVLFSSANGDAQTLVEHIQEFYPEHFKEWYEENMDEWPDDDAKSIASCIDDPCGWIDELGIDEGEIERIEMQKVTVELKYCLTESDANAFIARKQHDYPKLYTFVKSMVFCPQMVELREWILSLTKDGEVSGNVI